MKQLKLAIAALAATAALLTAPAYSQTRGSNPWSDPSITLNSEQLEAARRLNDYAQRTSNPARALGVDVDDVNWRYSTDWAYPMSNMTATGLGNLLRGRYTVQMFGRGIQGIVVRHYAADGRFHTCRIGYRGEELRVTQSEDPWAISSSYFGLAGTVHTRNGRGYSWPMVYDPRTGTIADYDHNDVTWRVYEGFVQSEIPAFAAEFCPDMPRAAVNAAQTQVDYDHARRAAGNGLIRTTEGVVFAVNPQAPLTAAMYYNQFPPAR